MLCSPVAAEREERRPDTAAIAFSGTAARLA